VVGPHAGDPRQVRTADRVSARIFILDSLAPNDDDTSRIRPLDPTPFQSGVVKLALELEPYGVTLVSLEARR
jgi:hypothetical protein